VISSKPGAPAIKTRSAAFAADGQAIEAEDEVLIRARVTGAAGPINDLQDAGNTGVVAIELDGFLGAKLKGCVTPAIVETVVRKADKPEPPSA
jgi:hypothetical protein